MSYHSNLLKKYVVHNRKLRDLTERFSVRLLEIKNTQPFDRDAFIKVARERNLKVAKQTAIFKKARENLLYNEQRIRNYFEVVRERTLNEDDIEKIRTKTKGKDQELRRLYVEAVRRGVVKPRVTDRDRILKEASDAVLCRAVQSERKEIVDDAVDILIDRNRASIEHFKRKKRGLDSSEIEVRAYDAVWRSARRYDPGHKSKTKFSTHLYRWLDRNSRARTKGDKGDGILAKESGYSITGSASIVGGDELCILNTVSERYVSEVMDRRAISNVRDAMKGLGDRHKRLIKLRFFENKSIDDISDLLDISKDEVLSTIGDALGDLRDFLLD